MATEMCDCEEAPATIFVTATDADGTVLDRVGYCPTCARATLRNTGLQLGVNLPGEQPE